MVTLPALRDRMTSSSSAASLDKQSPLPNSHRRKSHLRVQTLRLDSATSDSEEDDDEEFSFDFNEYRFSGSNSITPASTPATSPLNSEHRSFFKHCVFADMSSSGIHDAVDPFDDERQDFPAFSMTNLLGDMPDLNQMPSDVVGLQALVRSSHAALIQRNEAIRDLQSRFDDLTQSHEELLEKSSGWKDELEGLRTKVPDLEQRLNLSKAEHEESQARVKDLRLRAEESRRAIMRMQGERKTSTGPDKRASVSAGVAGWNPAVLGLSSDAISEQGESDVKAPSKRSTILFGAASRHARTGSNSRNLAFASPPSMQGEFGSQDGTTYRGDEGTPRALRLSSAERSLSASPSETDDGPNMSPELGFPSSSPHPRRSMLIGGSLAVPPATSRPPPARSQTPSPSLSGGLGSPMADSGAFPVPQRSSSFASNEGEGLNARAGPSATHLSPGPAGSGMSAMQVMRQKDNELSRMQAEVLAMRAKLDEALEARKASDACLRALKDFIGEGGPEGGEETRAMLRGVKLPPLPTDDSGAADDSTESLDDTAKGGDTWASKWASMMRKQAPASSASGMNSRKPPTGPAAINGRDGTPQMEFLSASPSKAASLAGSTQPEGEEASASGSSQLASGFSSFGAFFARSNPGTTPSITAASSAVSSPPPQAVQTGEDAKLPSDVVTSTPLAAAPTAAALNRVSGWFKRAPSTQGTSTWEEALRADSGASRLAPPGSGVSQSVDLAAGSEDSDGRSSVGSGLPPVPAKEIQMNPRAAKASHRSASVGEDGGLLEETGPFVPPTFE